MKNRCDSAISSMNTYFTTHIDELNIPNGLNENLREFVIKDQIK